MSHTSVYVLPTLMDPYFHNTDRIQLKNMHKINKIKIFFLTNLPKKGKH
jgi:hypothetical protein